MASTAPPILPPGSRLAGYQIDALVGRGGMGEVYRATQLSMDRVVALKILAPRLARDPAFADQFVAEARAAGQLNHPNIVAVHDVGQAPAPEGCHEAGAGEPVHYFSMEFIDGETVKDVIERQGAVDLPTVGKVMMAMAEALGFAEAHKIVHRDIKPDNIMLTSAGLVKLADLGLALQADSAEAVAGSKDEQGRGKVMGTPLYMAPEQARALPLDHRADQYALGSTLFHMLTGRPPYQGDSARAIMRAHCFDPVPDPVEANPQVPVIWRELCRRMMAKAPEERFGSSADLRAAVKSALRWKPGMAPRLRTARQAATWPLLGLAAAAVVVLVVIGLLVSGGGRSSPPSGPGPGPSGPQPVAVDPAVEVRANVARALAALPSDLDAALVLVQKMLDDPALAPARPEITARREALLGAKEERRRVPLRQAVEQAIGHANDGRLAEARTALAAVPAEAWLQPLRQNAEAALERAEDLLERQLGEAAGKAEDLRACNQIGERIRASGLGEVREKKLLSLLNRHRQTIQAAQQAAKPKPVDTSVLWRRLGEQIEPLRSSLPYSNLADAARSAARDFPEAERPQVEAIATAAELASDAEAALRLYIGQAKPVLECSFAGRSGTWKLTALDKDNLRFGLPDMPAGGSSTPRATAEVPWGRILSTALAAHGKTDPRIEAAFLWCWRQPDTDAALQRLKDDPFAAALSAYNLRTMPIQAAGEVQRRPDGGVAVRYPFASSQHPPLLGDWRGEGSNLTPRGLHWRTSKLIAQGTNLEADLPVFHWRQGLRMPLELDATLHPDGEGEIVLFGLSCPKATYRVALNPKLRKGFLIASLADDASKYQPLANKNPVSYNGLEPVRIRITVAGDGKVVFRLNESEIVSERPLAFPADAVLVPVVQARPVISGAGLTISQLTISGRP